METLTVVLTPPLPQHTHMSKHFLCDQWRAHMCPLYRMKANMQCQRQGGKKEKNMAEAYQASVWGFYINAAAAAKALPLLQECWHVLLWQPPQGLYVSQCEISAHLKIHVHMPKSAHLSDFTLTGSVLHLTFYPEILEPNVILPSSFLLLLLFNAYPSVFFSLSI